MPPIPAYGPGVVYFAHLADGRTKIGVTSNWNKRKENHISNGLSIDDEMLIGVTQARMAEKYYHKKFKDKRIEREFFQLEKKDWLEVIEESKELFVFGDVPLVYQVVFASWMNCFSCEKCGAGFAVLDLENPRCMFCDSEKIQKVYSFTRTKP